MKRSVRIFLGLSLALNLAFAAWAWLPQPSTSAQAGVQYFPQTHHTLSGRFLQYWTEHGGLAQQGYPVTEPFQERNQTDGKTYLVQYFQRAVFELHPENAAPNDVLLSLLGTFELDARYPNASNPAAAPVSDPGGSLPPTAAPVPTQGSGPPPAGEDAFSQYLAGKYNTISGQRVTWSRVSVGIPDITNHLTYWQEGFEVGTDQARVLIQQDSKADLTAWGTAILPELKAHWPGKPVAAYLSWSYESVDYDPASGCHFTAGIDHATGEWINGVLIVGATSSAAGADNVLVCGK